MQGNKDTCRCGMALNVASDNDLINNKKLAFTTFTSRNPTPHPPDNDTDIADSGSSHLYFAPGAPVMNYDATAPTIRVCIANGTPVHSIASGELALVTALPPASRKGHVMAGFPHSLIGLAPFVDAGCRVLFTNTSVIAFDKDGEVILEGWRETTGPKLWRWPLLPQKPPPPDLPQTQLQLGPCAYGTQMEAINAVRSIISSLHPCPVKQLVQSMPPSAFTVTASSKGGRPPFDPRRIDLPSIPALVAFYHACLGYLVKDSWLDAVKAGNCDTFDGLTYSNVARYCPDLDETILGHLAQTRQNVRSSKPPPVARPPLAQLPPPDDNVKEVYIEIYPINKLYSDDTGRFPIHALSGNQYVMIAYHTEGNLILQQAVPTKADKHRIPAFYNIMTHLTARGLSVDLNIRDNEASADFKRVITETWRAKFQLVPPDMHRRNKAE